MKHARFILESPQASIRCRNTGLDHTVDLPLYSLQLRNVLIVLLLQTAGAGKLNFTFERGAGNTLLHGTGESDDLSLKLINTSLDTGAIASNKSAIAVLRMVGVKPFLSVF